MGAKSAKTFTFEFSERGRSSSLASEPDDVVCEEREPENKSYPWRWYKLTKMIRLKSFACGPQSYRCLQIKVTALLKFDLFSRSSEYLYYFPASL